METVFENIDRATVKTDGVSLYDFLGVATRAEFKSGWDAHVIPEGRTFTPGKPPLNEHYFDWVLLLESIGRGSGVYRMAELGAGWGTWAARAAFAARRNKEITVTELVAVEADKTHYLWLKQHFDDNGLMSDTHRLIHGAVARTTGKIKFPLLENPAKDYGASTRGVRAGAPYASVRAYTLDDLVGRFTGPIDFMHVDMQGAEYDTLPHAGDLLSENVKLIMVGTHVSDADHNGLEAFFRELGWRPRMTYKRKETVQLADGDISLGDGLLAFENPAFV